MSKDSTCHLLAEDRAYETYSLEPRPTLPWPAIARKTSCSFPAWAEGHWEDVFVDSSTLVFKDRINFKTYSSKCVKRSPKNPERFLIYARTQCGEQLYNCIWLQPRGPNVMEFQLGLRPSQTPTFHLCDNDHFLQRTWHTQARQNPIQRQSCPIAGTYLGQLPDAPGLCARLVSNCDKREMMFYSVSDCDNSTNIYEDREYLCLGEWEEDGLLYTYTRRTHNPRHECFVGQVENGGRILLAEGGPNCRRGLRVDMFGMELSKRGSCGKPEGLLGDKLEKSDDSFSESSVGMYGWEGREVEEGWAEPRWKSRDGDMSQPWLPGRGGIKNLAVAPQSSRTFSSLPVLLLFLVILNKFLHANLC